MIRKMLIETVAEVKTGDFRSLKKAITPHEHTGTTTESDSGAEDPTSERQDWFLPLKILIALYKAPRESGRSRVTIIEDEGRVVKKSKVY